MIKVSKDTFQKMKEKGMIIEGFDKNYGKSKNHKYVQDNVLKKFETLDRKVKK